MLVCKRMGYFHLKLKIALPMPKKHVNGWCSIGLLKEIIILPNNTLNIDNRRDHMDNMLEQHNKPTWVINHPWDINMIRSRKRGGGSYASKHETWANVVLMLAKRRRQWANIKTTLAQSLVFAGIYHHPIENNKIYIRPYGHRGVYRHCTKYCSYLWVTYHVNLLDHISQQSLFIYTNIRSYIPTNTFTQCWVNVEPALPTVNQQ